MRKYLLSALIFVSLCACSLSGQSQSSDTRMSDVESREAKVERFSKQLDTITVPTKNIDSPAKVVVVLPEKAFQDNDAEFPTVYLLHGYDGNYSDWSKKANLQELANKYNCIIVCPDGRDSWYWDSPKMSNMQMESYIIEDLIPYIDDNFPTIIEPESRAITGLSMGGHGALWLAMRHPDVFQNVASMSGGVDVVKFPNKWGMARVLGRYEQNQKSWADHSVMSLLPSLKEGDLNILFDCGEQDMFYKVNVALSEALTKKGIKHTFNHRPGNHSWKYWTVSLPQHLQFFKKNFDAAAAE